METRYYQTQEITFQPLAQALVVEYQAQGYEAHTLVMSTRPPFN